MMNTYASGFNLYVEKHRKDLPDWIPSFDGVDVLANGRAEVMRFAFNDAMITGVQMKYPVESRVAHAASPRGYQSLSRHTSGLTPLACSR